MIVGILLAAGRGSRFGSTKQLATLADGRSMLATSAANLCAAINDVVIVVSDDSALQAHANTIARELDCNVIINPRAADGMGTSIAAGVHATRDADGWLIALADMPFIKPNSIESIATALKTNRGIITPTYLGTRGHPIGFDREFMTQLTALEGDSGARALITKHASRVTSVALADDGILRDVDTRVGLD